MPHSPGPPVIDRRSFEVAPYSTSDLHIAGQSLDLELEPDCQVHALLGAPLLRYYQIHGRGRSRCGSAAIPFSPDALAHGAALCSPDMPQLSKTRDYTEPLTMS